MCSNKSATVFHILKGLSETQSRIRDRHMAWTELPLTMRTSLVQLWPMLPLPIRVPSYHEDFTGPWLAAVLSHVLDDGLIVRVWALESHSAERHAWLRRSPFHGWEILPWKSMFTRPCFRQLCYFLVFFNVLLYYKTYLNKSNIIQSNLI